MNIFSQKNLTPLERARLKLITMFGLIGAFNAVLAIIAYFDHFKTLNWSSFGLIVGSQTALSILEALRKYFAAHGDVQQATTTQLAESELQAHAPTLQYTPNQLALQQALAALLANPQTDIAPPKMTATQQAGPVPVVPGQ